jgi:hypothetical protein
MMPVLNVLKVLKKNSLLVIYVKRLDGGIGITYL